MVDSAGGVKERMEQAIGEYLAELIQINEQQGVSRPEIAKKVGVNRSTVHRWARKEAIPENISAIKAILVLGGNLMELEKRMGGDQDLAFAIIFNYLTQNKSASEKLSQLMSNPEKAKQLESLIETVLKF